MEYLLQKYSNKKTKGLKKLFEDIMVRRCSIEELIRFGSNSIEETFSISFFLDLERI